MKFCKLARSFGILLVASTCFGQKYAITDLGPVGGVSYAYGINASGQVTGCAAPSISATPSAFLYSNGTMTDLGSIGGFYSCGQSINASGEVTGAAAVDSQSLHAFLYSHGAMGDLGTLGGSNSVGYGINTSGEMTGVSDVFSNVSHAFLDNGSTMTDIGTFRPDDYYSIGTAINDSGQIVGWSLGLSNVTNFLYSNGTWTDIGAGEPHAINALGHVTGVSGSHAFLYKNGVTTDLGVCPNLPTSTGEAINALDQVTGVCAQSLPGRAAFLSTPGQGMVDLNTLIPPGSGWKLTEATGINDAGQIIGNGINPNGQSHAFLLSLVGNKSTTATGLTSNSNSSVYGQKATLTATVTTSGSVPPTGTVVFMWNYFTLKYTIGTATLNSAGVATLTKSNLNADSYPMIAVYRGDTSNLGSTSAVLNQTVVQTTSAAAITSSANPSTVGQAVTFTAKITSPTVIPSGPVTFKAGTTVLGTAQLSSGRATFTTSTLPAGSTVVKVIYSGNSNIKGSSASVNQTVQP